VFAFFNILLGLMALTNLLGLAVGKYPTVRQIAGQLQASEDGRDQLRMALTMVGLVQIYMISLIFPLKALSHELGLTWAVLMVLSVLETIFTAKKMIAVVSGEDASGKFPVHDSRWYLAYQIAYNIAILAVVFILVAAPFMGPK
jgi:hypothetical protein